MKQFPSCLYEVASLKFRFLSRVLQSTARCSSVFRETPTCFRFYASELVHCKKERINLLLRGPSNRAADFFHRDLCVFLKWPIISTFCEEQTKNLALNAILTSHGVLHFRVFTIRPYYCSLRLFQFTRQLANFGEAKVFNPIVSS